MFQKLWFTAIAISATLALQDPAAAFPAGWACEEGFDDVDLLRAHGWETRNNSEPVGSGAWAQGNPAVFEAWAGPADSYAMVGADSGLGPWAVVSNWLVTPLIDFGPNGFGVRQFGFRTRALPGFVNRLVVRLCMAGEQTGCDVPGPAWDALGGYSHALLDINPDLLPAGYPESWTAFVLEPLDGLPVSGAGRIAFHYYVFPSPPDGSHGSVVGVDSVTMAGATWCPFDVLFANGFD